MDKEIEQILQVMYGGYSEAYNKANAKDIAEKIRGAVIWEANGPMVHDEKSRSWWFSPRRLDMPTLTWPDELVDFEIIDGKLYHVTVTKEE